MRSAQLLDTFRGMRVLATALTVAVVALSIVCAALVWMAMRRELVTILVPPNLTEQVQVLRNDADQAVYRSWAIYLAMLIGNVTPNTADFVRASLGDLVSANLHAEFMRVIAAEVQKIKTDRVALSFEPREAIYEAATNTWFVTGNARASGPGALAEDRQTKTYEFRLAMQEYRPVLHWISTYSGPPRTVERRRNEARADGGRS